MSLSKGGKKGLEAGYYLHCEPGAAFIGGGMWMPQPAELKKIRQEIDYNWEEFNGIVTNKKFKGTYGDINKSEEYILSRPPKGYEETNPAIEYLKLKSFVAMKPVSDEELLSDKLVKNIADTFSALKPMLDFINRAID